MLMVSPLSKMSEAEIKTFDKAVRKRLYEGKNAKKIAALFAEIDLHSGKVRSGDVDLSTYLKKTRSLYIKLTKLL